MVGRRRIAAVLAIAAFTVVCGAPQRVLRADPPAGAPPAAGPTEAQFLASLDRARVLLAAGDASGGQKLTDEALALHADKDYVRAKRADLEDLVKRLAFRVDCPPPDPAKLVKGSLKRFVSKTGDLEIRYAFGKPNDFETRASGALVFPARFAGPYTVVVKGGSYPYATDMCPQVMVGMEEDPKTHRSATWLVVPGVPPYAEGTKKIWLPARFAFIDGEETKMLSEKPSPAKPGDAWRLKVQVTRGKVIASINDASLGFANKPETVFGYAGVRAKEWSEIVIEGQIEPSWLQSKIDAIVEGKRAAFEAKFDVKKRLPAWLYREREGPAEDPSGLGLLGAEKIPPEFFTDVLKIRMLLLKDEDQEALEATEGLRARGAPESLVSTLAARAHLGLDQPSLALADVERALAAAPNGLDALELKATILLRLGREEESVAVWETGAKRPEATTEFFVAGSISLLLAGRLDAARRLTEGAARLGRRSEILDVIGRVLVQAANGPTWPKTFEYKTNNYHVQSDIDVETCSKAAMVLEEALQIYRDQVKPLKPEKRRQYKVYLFSGREGFARYMADVAVLGGGGHPNAAGVYSGLLKQLCIWNLPSRGEMMRTVRHEGFHQYLDRLLPDPPTWFNEGMAVYYEGMERIGGDLKIGRPRPDDLAVLEKQPLLPLGEFLAKTHAQFYEGSHHSYAQAWLFVHMLKNGSGKHRDLYKTLLSRLETSGGAEATSAIFDEKTLKSLDGDLAAYRLTLSKSR